jgi:hypothetical protein
MQRVKLEPLPEGVIADLEYAQGLVAANTDGLLAGYAGQALTG